MTKSLTLGLTADGAGLRIDAGSIIPVVTKSLSLGLTADGAGLRIGAGSIIPVVTVHFTFGLGLFNNEVDCIENLIHDELMTGGASLGNRRISQVSNKELHQSILGTGGNSHVIHGFNTINVDVGNIVQHQCVCKRMHGGNSNNGVVDFAKINDAIAHNKLNILERIIVAKNHNSCIRIDLIQHENGLCVVGIEIDVTVEVRLSGEGKNVKKGQFNSIDCTVAEYFSPLLGSKHIDKRLEFTKVGCIREKQVNHVNRLGEFLRNACIQQCLAQFSTSLIGVLQVFLTNKSGPIHLLNRLICQQPGLC